MPDPLTLSVVGAAALTEGIKFLYSQAGDVLRRWQERKRTGTTATAQPVTLQLPAAFHGQLSNPAIHFDAVQQLEQEIRQVRSLLADYADGIDPIEVADVRMLQATDLLRQLLEAVYGQRLTFEGEHRQPSGPLVEGTVDVGEVRGRVAAVRSRVIAKGTVRGSVNATRVEAGGQVVGVEADSIE